MTPDDRQTWDVRLGQWREVYCRGGGRQVGDPRTPTQVLKQILISDDQDGEDNDSDKDGEKGYPPKQVLDSAVCHCYKRQRTKED